MSLQEEDIKKLEGLARRVLKKKTSHRKDEAIASIQTIAKVDKDRAERGLKMMLEAEVIEITAEGRYYLAGSTPF